jgi:hypothetical protein
MAVLGLVVAVALAAVACSASDRHVLNGAATAPGSAASSERSMVFGLLWKGERAALARLDARTLRPVGRRIEVGGGGSQRLSPSRRILVAASAVVDDPSTASWRSELSLVDARKLRRLGRLRLRASGLVSDIVWYRPERFVVLLDDPARVVAVDRRPLRARAARPLGGTVVATDAKAGRLVVLLAPDRSIGPSRLAIVESDGRVRLLELGEIHSGWKPVKLADGTPTTRQRIPGLAVSPDGERAVVVPAGNRIADVELDSLRVSYHELSEPASLLSRLSDWLEPEADAKTVDGPDRFARWIGNDQVAVTGTTYPGVLDGGIDAARTGLRLIDTSDWSVRTLAKEAAAIVVACDLVLAYAWPTSARDDGIGLRAYGPDGKQRFYLFGNQPLDWVEPGCPYAYVPRHGGTRFDVVDLRSGRVVARPKPRIPVSVLQP